MTEVNPLTGKHIDFHNAFELGKIGINPPEGLVDVISHTADKSGADGTEAVYYGDDSYSI